MLTDISKYSGIKPLFFVGAVLYSQHLHARINLDDLNGVVGLELTTSEDTDFTSFYSTFGQPLPLDGAYLKLPFDSVGVGVGNILTYRNSSTESSIDLYFSANKIFDSGSASLYENGYSKSYTYDAGTILRALPIGDIDNDGLDDVMILTEIGQVNIYGRIERTYDQKILYGSNTTTENINLDEVTTEELKGITWSEVDADNDFEPYTIRSVGDINGDGIDDYCYESIDYGNLAGSVYQIHTHVIFGTNLDRQGVVSLSDLDGNNGFTISSNNGQLPDGSFNRSYKLIGDGIGDVNGDGYDDIVLYQNNSGPGNAIIYGNTTFPVVIDSIEEYVSDNTKGEINTFGAIFKSTLLDFNGDGYSDLVTYDGILYGSPSGFNAQTLFQDENGNRIRTNHIHDGGDFDGDGFDDILIDHIDHLILFGRANIPPVLDLDSNEKDTLIIEGLSPSSDYRDEFQFSPGDLNNDGLSDILVVSPFYNDRPKGRLHIVFGNHNRWEDVVSSPYNVITSYRSAFQGPTQSAGWNYYWNPTTAIGNAAEYQQLKWTGWNYDNDGISGRNDDQFNYGNLNENGGHPGKGDEQGGVSYDRYVIAAYQVGQDGVYAIQDSFIDHTTSSCSAWSNGDDVRVYVNDGLRLSVPLPKQGSVAFDTALGELAAGDQVYVAIGPNGKDGCDGFSMDYAIALEGDLINTPPVFAPIADQTSDEGISVSFSVSANDAQNDNVTYSAEGLPENVEISATGMISGTPSTAGEYDVTVTATDTNGTYDVASFTWIVGSTGNVIANFYDDFAGENWSYTWNQNSVIGDRSGYVDLAWNGYDFRSGESTYPATSELGYGFIGPRSAHPGNGVNQAVSDRFVIAGYTVDLPGSYQLKEASVEHLVSSCSAWSNGLEVRVYVDDDLIDTFTVAKESLSSINTNLGAVTSGQTVFVAVGPNGTAGCDRFSVNFDLVMD